MFHQFLCHFPPILHLSMVHGPWLDVRVQTGQAPPSPEKEDAPEEPTVREDMVVHVIREYQVDMAMVFFSSILVDTGYISYYSIWYSILVDRLEYIGYILDMCYICI